MPEVDCELYKLITVSGADAAGFLQGQLTQDVALLAGMPCLLAACCNPQGRVITTMRLVSQEESIGMILPGEMAEPIMMLLSKYRMRSKVQFAVSGDDWANIAIAENADLQLLQSAGLLPDANDAIYAQGILSVRHGSKDPFVELFAAKNALARLNLDFNAPLADDSWRSALICAGIALISDENSEKYTPHMLNLDRLGAISFDKGCYTGQEVVARTEHLGSSKRRLMRYRCAAKSIKVGDSLDDGDRQVGKVVKWEGVNAGWGGRGAGGIAVRLVGARPAGDIRRVLAIIVRLASVVF
jgi:folate-binding protein YgfZ